MLSTTTSGSPTSYSETGLSGDMKQILFPIHHGILFYVGFDVLPPYIAWSVSRVDQECRQKYLDEYEGRLLSWRRTQAIRYPSLEDYDESFQLKKAR